MPGNGVLNFNEKEAALAPAGQGNIPLPRQVLAGLQGVLQQVVEDDAQVKGVVPAAGGVMELGVEADALLLALPRR